MAERGGPPSGAGDTSHEGNNNFQEKSDSFVHTYRSFDKWVLVHFFTIFSFSFLIGIIIIHGSLLWHKYYYQSMPSGEERNNEFVKQLMYQYYGEDLSRTHQIAANTSVYLA